MAWIESAAGVVVPPSGVPGGAGGDICPSDWTEDFDRAAMTTEVIIGRATPTNIPDLHYTFPGTVPPAAGTMSLNGAQSEATVMYLSRTETGGGDVTAWLQYINEDGRIRFADADDTGVAIGYGVTGPPSTGPTHVTVPIVWVDGQTPVPSGAVTVTITPAVEPPRLFFDAFGRNTYGRETFTRTDLIRTDPMSDIRYEVLADRILEIRGSNSVPRVDTVTIDARHGGIANMELMSTARPDKPSRYQMRLQVGGRVVYNRMMFVTAIRHSIERDEWTLQMTLDVAEWAAVEGA